MKRASSVPNGSSVAFADLEGDAAPAKISDGFAPIRNYPIEIWAIRTDSLVTLAGGAGPRL